MTPTDREFGALQQEVKGHGEELKNHDNELVIIDKKVDEHYKDLKAQLNRMEADATRQRGFVAGIVFLATCIGAALGLFKDFIISHVFK